MVTPLRETSDGQQCTVSRSTETAVRYTRSDVKTGTFCKYKCVEDPGYKCRYGNMRDRCSCMPVGARVVTVGVVGHGIDMLGETCDDKFEGYEFADAVACTRVRGEFRVDSLVEIEEGRCVRKVKRVLETRFMRTERAGRNVGGCVYVCKKRGLKCEGREVGVGQECECDKRGLRKVLIGLEERKMGRVEQTVCKGGDCGPCGVCADGECVLKKDSDKGDHCECGEICPESDRRTGNRGGKLYCEMNWKLGCSAGKKWMKNEGGGDESGRRVPDKCYEGKIDAADRCGCAKGFDRVLSKHGAERCVRRK